jgi:hypothetical protein
MPCRCFFKTILALLHSNALHYPKKLRMADSRLT